MNSKFKIPFWLWIAVLIVLFSFLFTPVPLLGLLGMIIFIFIINLLWKKNLPPLLLYGGFMVWFTAGIQLIYYGIFRLEDPEVYKIEPGLRLAILLTLIASLVFSVGMAVGSKGVKILTIEELREEASGISTTKAFYFYLFTFIFFYLLTPGQILSLGGLAQIIFALENLKWAVTYFLLLILILKREKYYYFLIVLGIEIISGFLGFFAGFRGILLVLVIVLLTVRSSFKVKNVVGIGVIVAFAFYLGLYWSAIKNEYRFFLSQGTRTQTVQVSVSERVDKLQELLSAITEESINEAEEALVDRVGYLEFFAQTIANIPENMAYEGGRNWWDAIMHVLKPRLLFPDKPIVHDSIITERLTGHFVPGLGMGSSFSVGYIGESYADFGPVFMFVPIFLVGLFYGGVFKYLVNNSGFTILGFSLATAFLLFSVGSNPSLPKLVGKNIYNLIIVFFVLKYLNFRIQKLLSA